MPRAPRILGDDITYHVVSKCNANSFLFKTEQNLHDFLLHIQKCQKELKFDFHAYCFMQSHIHIILTTRQGFFLNKIMHAILQRFSFRYNRQNKSAGHFWKNHYFSKIINNDVYGLTCLRYLHLNPVKAKMVDKPADWPWSCANMYMTGNFRDTLTPLPSYLGLAQDSSTRKIFYNQWLETPLISQRCERRIFEGKLRAGSRRFEQILDKEIAPILSSIKNQ